MSTETFVLAAELAVRVYVQAQKNGRMNLVTEIEFPDGSMRRDGVLYAKGSEADVRGKLDMEFELCKLLGYTGKSISTPVQAKVDEMMGR